MSDYLTVRISVDALEWTDHWLTEGQRCDILSVSIACSELISPKIKIVAIESKARSEVEPIALSLEAEPFKNGVAQVVATLDALEEILCATEGSDVVSDLKQDAFVQHLLSEVLSTIYPVPADRAAAYTHVIKQLTQLSRRELTCDQDLQLSGMVVTTQRNATVPTLRESKKIPGEVRDWSVELIRCGVPHLKAIFEELGLSVIGAATIGTEAPGNGESGPAPPTEPEESGRPSAAASTSLGPSSADTSRASAAGSGPADTGTPNEDETSTVSGSHPQEVLELVAQLEAALRLRQFPTEPISPELTVVGPTLLSVPVVLKAGHSSKGIESAKNDIARELGVRAIAVENDARAYHIRFLIPRRDRSFPRIPENSALAYDAERRQYLGILLGVGVDGNAFRSFVSEWPHLLVAGTTGSGKTTFLKSIIVQLATLPESTFEIVIVDGKAEYDYIGLVPPHVFVEQFPDVLLGHENAPTVLKWLVEQEIPRRRNILGTFFQKNPTVSRQPREALVQEWSAGRSFPIKPIIVFIDEFAEIMQAAGSGAGDFEALVQRAVQTGRSALVHLMLATQRPDASVIAGAIKANIPSRVALALPSHHDSMTILNSPGAEDLIGSGDLLFLSSSVGLVRLQAFNPGTR